MNFHLGSRLYIAFSVVSHLIILGIMAFMLFLYSNNIKPVVELQLVALVGPVKSTIAKSTTNKVSKKQAIKPTKKKNLTIKSVNKSINKSTGAKKKVIAGGGFKLKAKKSDDSLNKDLPAIKLDQQDDYSVINKNKKLAKLDTSFKLDKEKLIKKSISSEDDLANNSTKVSPTILDNDNLVSLSTAKSLSFYSTILAYQNQLIIKVRRHWKPPSKSKIKGVYPTVVAYIKSDGTLLKTNLSVSSSDSLLNTLALNAVKLAGPFAKLPADFPTNKILVVPFKFKNEESLF